MELKIVKFFNQLGSEMIDLATDFLSRIRYLLVFWSGVTFAALLFDRESRSKLFVALIVATAAHFAVNEGLIKRGLTRFWGVRQRPYVAHPDEIKPIGRKFSDSSFPSSHMSSTLAMLTVLAYFYPVTRIPALIFVILMAFARLHNGMHYPSDILAGIFLGIGYGSLGIYIIRLMF